MKKALGIYFDSKTKFNNGRSYMDYCKKKNIELIDILSSNDIIHPPVRREWLNQLDYDYILLPGCYTKEILDNKMFRQLIRLYDSLNIQLICADHDINLTHSLKKLPKKALLLNIGNDDPPFKVFDYIEKQGYICEKGLKYLGNTKDIEKFASRISMEATLQEAQVIVINDLNDLNLDSTSLNSFVQYISSNGIKIDSANNGILEAKSIQVQVRQ